MRIKIGGQKYAKAKYDRLCLTPSKDEIEERKANGESYVIRMKIPKGKTVFKDIVHGKVVFDNKDIDDQVILKNDGYPTYHLANVVDDYTMQISHVIRGEVSKIADTHQRPLTHLFICDCLGMATIDPEAPNSVQDARN